MRLKEISPNNGESGFLEISTSQFRCTGTEFFPWKQNIFDPVKVRVEHAVGAWLKFSKSIFDPLSRVCPQPSMSFSTPWCQSPFLSFTGGCVRLCWGSHFRFLSKYTQTGAQIDERCVIMRKFTRFGQFADRGQSSLSRSTSPGCPNSSGISKNKLGIHIM